MIVHIDKYSIQTIMNMELNIDDEWSEFLSITDGSPTPNNERAVELPIQSSTECPKASNIYISTKTNISYLNIPVNLTDMFWKIPVIGYGMPSEGVVKKQMKFNLTTREELEQLQNNLKNYTCVEQNIITSIDNPAGRIKFKDIRKVSIGLCKKDIVNYRSKKKSAFYNCFVVIVRLQENGLFKEYHVKVFNTGKLEIPGIQSDQTFYNVLNVVMGILSPYSETPLEVLHDKTHTVLINSNFNCGFYINREVMFNLLRVKYKIDCIYDPCSYPGIQCKFFYYKGVNEQSGTQQPGVDGEVSVSFMVFRTGSVLIVGKCDEYVLRIIYQFLKKILAIEFTQIGVKVANAEASSKQQTKKIRRKMINV